MFLLGNLDYSDDTAMARCVVQSILTRAGFDERDMAHRYTNELAHCCKLQTRGLSVIWHEYNVSIIHKTFFFFKGLLRSTVNPRTEVMAVESSMCWRSCPRLSSVMFFNQPGTSLMVAAPLGMEGPWGRLPLLWLSRSWPMWEGWASLCYADNLAYFLVSLKTRAHNKNPVLFVVFLFSSPVWARCLPTPAPWVITALCSRR